MATDTSKAAPKREEEDVYDRQIRLWGAEAQAKMSKAKVLYIHITGVSSEVLKNLVLAGIRATLCDNRPFPSAVDDCPSFFLAGNKKRKVATVAQAMQPVVEELNPLLGTCEVIDKDAADLEDSYFANFSIVVASRLGKHEAVRIAKATQQGGGKFFMVDSFGMDGACVMDLGKEHSYRPELGKKLLDPKQLETHVPLEAILNAPLADATNRFHKTPPPVWIRYQSILEYHQNTKKWPVEESKDDFCKLVQRWIQENSPNLNDNDCLTNEALERLSAVAIQEVAPICAVVGGLVGNEVIKAISGKGEPANNTILFEGDTCKAWTFLVCEKSK